MSYFRLLISLTALLLLAVPGMADEDEENWRNFEVILSGGLSVPSGDMTEWYDSLGAKSGMNIYFGGAYYFSEPFCIGLYFDYSRWGIEGPFERNFHTYDFGTYFKYAIVNESNFEPYFKASAGLVWPKYPTWVGPDLNILREQSYDPGYGIAGYAGMLYYTSDYGSLYMEVGYHNASIDGLEAQNYGTTYTIENNAQYLSINLGVTVFFGPEY